MDQGKRKHILITFGRSFLTLNLARLLAAAGHRVSTADSVPIAVSRFSTAVTGFHRVSPPKYKPQEYCRQIAAIVESEGIDMVIPIHEETDILAMMAGLFPPSCELFLSDFALEDALHNKLKFQELLVEMGVETLKFASITGPDDIAALDFNTPFAVKQAYSRGSQNVIKAYPGDRLEQLTFDPTNPWIAQEWLEGDRYCTYSICRDGEVYAHATYPVRYAIGGSSCLTFEQVPHAGIEEWVRDVIKRSGFTGHIGFDFIDHPERGLVTIEANPRATSGIMMFTPEDHVDRAFFGENDEVIEPPTGRVRMIGIGMALYGWRKDSLPGNNFRQFFRDFRAADDVIAEKGDMGPAVMLVPAYSNILRHSLRYRVGLAGGFMHDHEWDGHQI
ncbi:ATP-grasp domain-containing protein [Gordonia alkaliphila]|uniref:ATP-grasp domain-containing protein n=1 Tax=Gordonia alkaliphila TaxID=1053547 RepID=UPI001FF2B9DD|nr:ATP-grasp domain-containing protein [Gordonia alkaliphila]MCK0439304.1 ATP-grasp domain-containing protein [Gordonia alkaliphila]